MGLISVSLGLDKGIKRLSQINMTIAGFLLLAVLLLGPTLFILNSIIQNAGVYLNQIIQLSTWTEAYEDTVYQNAYTLFYFTWWFAWAPFVSLFIARISYGRSIKEFIVGVLFVPSLIVFIWMGVFGNVLISVLNNIGDITSAVSNDVTTALFVLYDSMSFSLILSTVTLFVIVTFFVTSSDSGALVASMLSSKKGADIEGDSPLVSRITWAILLGVLAGVLLKQAGWCFTNSSCDIWNTFFYNYSFCLQTLQSLDDEFNS